MKKLLLTIFSLTLLSCGTKSIKDDPSNTNDYEARFESVFTSVGTESNFGPSVYQFSDLNVSLKIYTLLSGSYEIKSNSCGFFKTGRYSNSEVISIPLSAIVKDPAEKLCSMTIQINPEYAKSQYAISPRYSIVYLQYTNRVHESYALQLPENTDHGKLFTLSGLDKYRLIQNCVNAEPKIIKESLIPANAEVFFAELNQKTLGSCYYSLVYSKVGIASRLAFAINIYDSLHAPLQASATLNKKKLEVVSESTVSVCVIGNEYKIDNKCKGEAQDGVLIQVHSNKRSYYKIWRK